MGDVPNTEIRTEIKHVINKLNKEDKKVINQYIKELLESNYNNWENAMGEDL